MLHRARRPAQLLLPLVVTGWLVAGCGAAGAGDCSGGSREGGACVNTQPVVDWTADLAASEIARQYNDVRVAGRLRQLRCSIIVDKGAGHEAVARCSGVLVTPARRRPVELGFFLNGNGIVNADCSFLPAENPWCRT